jgi:hypothetical protein
MQPARFCVLAALALAGASAAGLGCSGQNRLEPGTVLGTYKVEAKKVTGTCGDAPYAPNPWTFTVRLSRDGSKLYWLQNRQPIEGHVVNGKVTFETWDARTVRSADRTGRGFCQVGRTDTLEGTLGADVAAGDAGTAPGTLSGRLRYAFVSSEGSDCSGIDEPSVTVLPCELSYDIVATRTGP